MAEATATKDDPKNWSDNAIQKARIALEEAIRRYIQCVLTRARSVIQVTDQTLERV